MPNNDIKQQCPTCESTDIKQEIVVDNFDYGSGEDAIKLSASIPVMTCIACGFQFTDYRAENIKHVMIENIAWKKPI